MSAYPTREEIARVRKVCDEARVQYVGVQSNFDGEHFVMFNPPREECWATINLRIDLFTPENVKSMIERAKESEKKK
jgi:hypothetical protein